MTQGRWGESKKTPARRGISRRGFLKMSGAGLAGAALLGAAGCGGDGGPERTEDGSILFTFSFGVDPSGTLQDLVKRFNGKYGGRYKAEYREMGNEYLGDLRTELQAGGGEIALIGGDVIWPAELASNGWIADLSDRFPESERKKFLDGPIEANIYEGKVYGVPWFTDAGLLYYRKDLLEKSGFSEPPKTWEELKEQAAQVRRASGTESGFVFQGSNYEGGVVNGLEYINSHGGSVLAEDDPDKVVISNPESIAALQMERSMVEDGIAPQSVAQFTEQESHAAFLRGDSVFCRNRPYMYALAADPEQSRIKQDQIGVAPLPAASGPNGRSVSGLGGWSFLINAAMDQKTQDAAWKFIEFASTPEQQKFRAVEGGFLPTLKALYKDQEVLDAVPVIKQAPEVLSRTVPRPVSPYYSDMSLKMSEQFNASLTGKTAPAKAIKTLQDELQNIAEQTS